MATLNDIVQINITTQSAGIKQPGFGVPLIMDAHSRFSERIRFYTAPADMLTDGFLATDAAYRAAEKMMSQNPQVARFAVGRRANLPTLEVRLTPVAVASKLYSVKLNGLTASFTSDSTPTVAEICAGLTTQLSALAQPGLTVSDQTTHVRILGSAPGNWFHVEPADISILGVSQNHADPGITADLDNVVLENDEWYGFTLTTGSQAEIVAAAAWVETKKKIAFFTTQDSACATVASVSANDVAETLKDSNYFRSTVWVSPKFDDFLGAAMLGDSFPYDPGSYTYRHKQLAGVTASPFTTTHITNLRAKNANFVTTFGGTALTADGKMASGEWIDIIRDRDWFESRLQVRIANVLANNTKLPFTDGGISVVAGEVRAALKEAQNAGFLADDTTPTVIVPRASEVSPSDRAARRLTGISFSARIAGAIHATTINGTITV